MSCATSSRIDGHSSPGELWARVAAETARWAGAANASLRDTVVLLPYVQVLDDARRAFAALGGWQPRIETTATLALALAPPAPTVPGDISAAPVLDALVLAQLLRAQAPMAAWERQDPAGFAQIVQATLGTAHDLWRAAGACAPDERPAWWAAALQALGVTSGPGALEASLCRVALEWARLSAPPATDTLFALRPAAWVVVQAGGRDALAAALLVSSTGPALLIDTDAPVADPFGAVARFAAPRCIAADGLEGEARAAAAEVIAALNAGHAPVALIALDRVSTRRVRALLERQGVRLADETGWTLSTTRAAARVMALLRAARPAATADERLEWLKTDATALADPTALQRLESLWRAGRSPDPLQDHASARLWAHSVDRLVPLAAASRRTLAGWLEATAQVLEATGLASALRADAAGAQALAALRLAPELRIEPAWASALRAESVDLAGFIDWTGRVFEQASFVPPAAGQAEVVLTPLARAVLRPFGAVVIAGADERHLGALSANPGLLPEALARALGIDTAATRLLREQLALAQVLHTPRVSFVHRRLDGNEPVAASPMLDALALARARIGAAPIVTVAPATAWQEIVPRPVRRPAPCAAGALPQALSASAVESLRACPYRFFARSVLRLSEAEELDETLVKRDYGNWLHAVLHRFHRLRETNPDSVHNDVAALHEAAALVTAETGLDPARLLPFSAGFENLLPAYLAWLHRRDAAGLRWIDGERSSERVPPELGGLRLRGRIDRIDSGAGAIELIDYKTGSVQGLKAQLRNRLEDTQLAFYALLMHADEAAPDTIGASYLALDDAQAPLALPHPELADSARQLLRGLAGDLKRLRAGAGLAALGEGPTCEHCEARGLCRRDHWAAPQAQA